MQRLFKNGWIGMGSVVPAGDKRSICLNFYDPVKNPIAIRLAECGDAANFEGVGGRLRIDQHPGSLRKLRPHAIAANARGSVPLLVHDNLVHEPHFDGDVGQGLQRNRSLRLGEHQVLVGGTMKGRILDEVIVTRSCQQFTDSGREAATSR